MPKEQVPEPMGEGSSLPTPILRTATKYRHVFHSTVPLATINDSPFERVRIQVSFSSVPRRARRKQPDSCPLLAKVLVCRQSGSYSAEAISTSEPACVKTGIAVTCPGPALWLEESTDNPTFAGISAGRCSIVLTLNLLTVPAALSDNVGSRSTSCLRRHAPHA